MMEIHVSDKLDLPVSDGQVRTAGHAPSTLHELNGQMGLVETLTNNSGSQNAVSPKHGMGLQQFVKPNQQFGKVGTLSNHLGGAISTLPSKRKAEVEPMVSHSVSQQSPFPNKRVAQTGVSFHSSGILQSSAPSKKGVQMQPRLGSSSMQNQAASNKKMVRNDSSKTGSERVQTPKGRTAQIESTSKVSTESTEAVRSKMRESLAAALELACQNQDRSVTEDKNMTQSAIDQIPPTSHPPESDLAAARAGSDKGENPQNTSPLKEPSGDRPSNGQRSAAGLPTSENVGIGEQVSEDFQCGTDFTCEDVPFTDNFFIKDELLQGNGLSWAWEVDMDSRETIEIVNDVKAEGVHEDGGGNKGEQARPSPRTLAFKIEAELFKLFGGVNKKYKEKGRSLLFNLKDRNNPELRERVMSGDISPERLCSMTAEELASKELSEWRMAKAEELAQMVVLPDTDVNMRRLVKKTHKGEYQVEMEKDDGIAVEVSTGISSLVQLQQKEKERGAHPPEPDDIKDKESVRVQKGGLINQDLSGRLIIPNDGTDLMQGMIVDEIKDAEFLPPIVSLDEFMESLDSEPPFENLPVDAGQRPPSDKESSEAGDKLVGSDVPSKDPVGTLSVKATKKVKEQTGFDAAEKPKQSPVVQKISAPDNALMAGCLWQGSVQLNISSSVTVMSIFRSGEKTPTKEWPALLEVKGRVRLDAFEKFLQELPMSRSRAVMVLHFILKDSTSENERASLREAMDSYVSDERLGYAEPAPGVELYLCPPDSRILDMLSKHLSNDRIEFLNSTDNGLIGVVIWRKPHLTSSLSPNSSARYRNSSKRQHRQHEKDVNGNSTPKGPATYGQPRSNPPPQDDDDDDIPPGFGPAAARDGDDLPEFSFSGNVNQSVNRFPVQNPFESRRVASFNQPFHSYRPVDQMRELVQKYGQTMTMTTPRNRGLDALGLEPWDDDDDIPEWRPQPPPKHSFQQPMQAHAITRAPTRVQHLPKHHVTSWQQGPRPAHPGRVNASAQYYGIPARTGQARDWSRQGVPRSRAF